MDNKNTLLRPGAMTTVKYTDIRRHGFKIKCKQLTTYSIIPIEDCCQKAFDTCLLKLGCNSTSIT